MMSIPKLTEAALATIMKGGQVENPIMQVLGSKKIVNGSGSNKERYRLLLSDGKYLISFAMLTPQINDKISTGEIPQYTIIKVKRCVTSVISNTGANMRILVILEMEMLVPGDQVGQKIGTPIQLPDELLTEQTEQSAAAVDNKDNDYAERPAKRPNLGNAGTSSTTLSGEPSLSNMMVYPISSLSPYQNKWVIKARVTNKSAVRTWSNSRGEGKLFSMDIIDESGEIRVTAFRDMVDKYYDFIVVDKVYYFTKLQMKMANKQFTSIKNDYEMTIGNDTIIQECFEADNIPTTQYNFTNIDKIQNMEIETMLDVIGICKQASDLQVFTAKSSGREMKKRDITLVDASKTAVSYVLWGKEAEDFNGDDCPVIAIKGAKIKEFGGARNLNGMSGTIFKVNPDIPEAHKLRGWYDNGGGKEESANISAKTGSGNFQTTWMSFKDVLDAGMGRSDRGDFYQTKGTVLLMRSEKAYYKACPQESCNKKVIDMENGQYRCEKCNVEYPNFKYRILGSINVGDWSGNQWLSVFSEEAEKIIGLTADQLGERIEANKDAMAEIAQECTFKQFIFRCRAKMETYNDEARLKTVAVRVDPLNYKDYNSYLISQIDQMMN